MYSTTHPVSAPMNGMGGELVDGSGTINPAALNAAGLVAPPVAPTGTASRGLKRSRSPDQYGQNVADDNHEGDDQGRRKRGRPPKLPRPAGGTSVAPSYAGSQSNAAVTAQAHTPQLSSQSLPHHSDMSPPQTSPPPKTTPTKPLVKALPTVRDHTTDQLSPEGDEYIPKEFDEAGEKKVDALGYPQEGREYKCRTFRVPNRGEKLFMLATECARVLGYRDSYLLFNKNRSLYKIIATQVEKDNLIQQDILPYSYRSRQIAIVTAKSMFRQFGSRVIQNGRRVRDDYWESKARKQGFTEEDLAGEKRPGAAKARDAAAAAEAAANASLIPNLSHSDVVYSNMDNMPQGMPPGLGAGTSLAPLPMIHLSTATDDMRLREFNSMPRSRQEMTGQPYQDRSQPSSAAEILNQASHTADFSKILNSQRAYRHKGMDDFYAAQRDIPISTSQPQPGQLDATASTAGQSLQSPQLHSSSGMINPNQQHQGVLGQQQSLMSQPGYSQQTHQQPSMTQSPVRGVNQGIRPDALHQRSSNPAMSSPASAQTPAYGGYGSQASQIWGQPPPQPQPSPISASPHMSMHQYAGQMHSQQHQSPSPLPHHAQQQQQQPQPPHQSPSPHNQHRPSQQMPQSLHMHQQLPQGGNMATLGYQGGPAGGYPNVGNPRAMYAPGHNPGQQFFTGAHQQPGMTMGMGGPGMPGWPSGAGGHMQAGASQPGQSGSPLGGWSGY